MQTTIKVIVQRIGFGMLFIVLSFQLAKGSTPVIEPILYSKENHHLLRKVVDWEHNTFDFELCRFQVRPESMSTVSRCNSILLQPVSADKAEQFQKAFADQVETKIKEMKQRRNISYFDTGIMMVFGISSIALAQLFSPLLVVSSNPALMMIAASTVPLGFVSMFNSLLHLDMAGIAQQKIQDVDAASSKVFFYPTRSQIRETSEFAINLVTESLEKAASQMNSSLTTS